MKTLLLHIIISLLTCDPGAELYARFGHTAIRVQDTELNQDWVFNYGLFSFQQPHFYSRFIKGETYYQLGVEYTSSFYAAYAAEGRRIFEQKLDLNQDQALVVRDALLTNYRPENREYLYNFVFDNCATRPYHLLYPEDSTSHTGANGPTYRQLIHRCVGTCSISAFGIDLLLGPKADMPGDSLFLPECLMNYVAATPLVKDQTIAPFPEVKIPWYENYCTILSIFFVLMLLLTLHDRKRKHLTWSVDATLLAVYLIVISIVTYLTFFSLHPLVGFGWRLLIIPTIHLCSRLLYWLPSQR